MSSLVKEDLEKKLFKPLSQNLYEFIEIEFSDQDRYYLCVSGKPCCFLVVRKSKLPGDAWGWWELSAFIFLCGTCTFCQEL